MNVGFSIKSIGLFLKLHRAVKEEKKKTRSRATALFVRRKRDICRDIFVAYFPLEFVN